LLHEEFVTLSIDQKLQREEGFRKLIGHNNDEFQKASLVFFMQIIGTRKLTTENIFRDHDT
jgi:hypothetical protein